MSPADRLRVDYYLRAKEVSEQRARESADGVGETDGDGPLAA